MTKRLVLSVVAAVAAAACSTVGPKGLTAPAPVPEAPERPVALAPPTPIPTPAPSLPAHLLEDGATLTLADVVDIALRNNPVTRVAYFEALSAAADLGSARSAYYPRLDLTADVSRAKQSALGGQFDFQQTSYGPTVDLSWLVLDLGGRAADAEAARLALLAADWSHTAAVQNVILGVQQTFVAYLNARAQLEAARTSVTQAQAANDAATVRHEAGVATIAEVLQAKTALSQAQLAVDRLSGEVLALRGALATAMGLPATTPYDVGNLPDELPLDFASKTVEELIEQARAVRPDLAAARLEAERGEARIRSFRAQGLPRLSLGASATRTWFDPARYADYGDSWSARLMLDVPLFTGFATRSNTDQARQDAAASAARADTLEQEVILQVWTSYYGLQTATQLVRTSRDLLASAEQSERVAMGRYREGVGTILDLLAAQAALADARAQEILARSAWFAALAQLARDTGVASPTLKAAVAVTTQESSTP
ncbi:MAG: TolC family protein [Thermoanaerobaculales bacterium]|jgi:outer membrane protein TolC|nr:TolC family protein [Thermoanaerobaculales bacterium]